MLGRPRRVRVIAQADGPLQLWPERAAPVRLARRVLTGNGAVAAVRDRTGAYLLSSEMPAGRYGVANYERFFALIRLEGAAEEAEREAAWAAQAGYHEHRAPSEQDEAARARSRWLAEHHLDGESVLEVGCGAGRNLLAVSERRPETRLAGVDVNAPALAVARGHLPDADLRTASAYELPFDGDSFDVAFTSGVLMHIPHDRVEGVVRAMHAAARRVVHLELHGPSHGFDYHRYPRDYGRLYERLGLPASYEQLTGGCFDYPSFRLALLRSPPGTSSS